MTGLIGIALSACGDDAGASSPTPDAARHSDARTPDATPPDATPPAREDATPPSPDATPLPDACAALAAEATLGGWRVVIGGATWFVTPPGASAPVLTGPTGCVAGDPAVESATGAPDLESNYGAFKITLEGAGSDMVWRAANGPRLEVREGEGVRLVAEGGELLRFDADPARPDHLWVRAEAAAEPDSGGPPTGVGLRLACAPGEAFFGLGTQVVDLDLRGRAYPLWTQEQGIGKPEGGLGFPLRNVPEAAYAPMGVWQALRLENGAPLGYGAIVERDEFAELDLCKADATRVRLRTLHPTAGLLLVPGDTPRARLAAATAVVGRLPDAPPDWVFAPWNDSVGGPARLREVAETLRREGVPSSAVWAEDWIGGEDAGFGYRLSYAWAWDPTRYPDLAGDVAWLHANGFAFLAYFNPFVPETTAMFAEGVDGDFLIKDTDGELVTFFDPAFRNTSLVDLTHPPAVAWLKSYLERAAAPVEEGGLDIDGWMADFAEWLPVRTLLRNGETGWAAHNRYPLLWQAINREALESARGPGRWVYFARSGWASTRGGTGRLAPTMWGGDQNTNWGYDDGLPTVVPIGAHVGFGGVSIFGSDVGGYTSVMIPPTTKPLFFRWAGLAAFTPLMRTHHGSTECRNWSFDRDPETLAHYRRYASVHTRLFPYLQDLLADALASGWPLLRHPALVEPSAPNLWAPGERVFFLGDDLFVSPVVDEGAFDWPVTLPPGAWWPLFGGAVVQGGGDVVQAAPLTEVPAFVRAGTALPLLTDAPATMYPLGEGAEAGLEGLEAARLRITVALYPDADGSVRPQRLRGLYGADDAGPEVHAEGLPEAGEVAVVGPGEAALGPSGRVFVRGGPVDVTYTFVVGGAAWGDLRASTPVGDPNPDIPPPCEVGHED